MAGIFTHHAQLAFRRFAVVAGGVTVAINAALLIWMLRCAPPRSCEWELQHGEAPRAVGVCFVRYLQTGSDRDLSSAARAYMNLGELELAAHYARELLGGERYGDAHAILSFEALSRDAGSEAMLHASIALVAHLLAGDERGWTSDAIAIAQVASRMGEFSIALDAADAALPMARELGNTHYQITAYLVRADVLHRIGETDQALAALKEAGKQSPSPCDQAWIYLRRGVTRYAAGDTGMALYELAMAERTNASCGSHVIPRAIAGNRAWLHREKRTPRDALAALAALEQLAGQEPEDVDALVLRGYLAADRGELAAADRYLRIAADHDSLAADWPWTIESARAELFELRGGVLGDVLAAYHYHRAIAMIAALRSTALERAVYLVASHREPYDSLIALLARHGLWREVLAVILELDAGDMLRSTSAGLKGMRPSTLLGPGAPASAPVSAADVDAVLAAWWSRDLVIVIAPTPREIGSGRERAYRVRVTGGQVTGMDIGAAENIQRWAKGIWTAESYQDAARALGERFVPSGTGTLDVLAIGVLGKVPLPALRDRDGSLTIRRRPLAHVLRLRATSAEATGTGPPVVIANPRGDLANADFERVVVASTLGPGALVFGWKTATLARMQDAHNAVLLHLAGHVESKDGLRVLRLADGDLDAMEIVRQRIAPRIAVLAGCGSAAATDDEGWGSIAAAMLEAGTAIVIATDRPVGDAVAFTVMKQLYAQPNWEADPAAALATVQQALDARAASSGDTATGPGAWSAFSVLVRPPVVPAQP